MTGGRAFVVRTDDGAVLHGESVGRGPVVVLVHCWTGSRTTWRPVAERLVDRGMTVVAYDQRGHGRSTAGATRPLVERLSRDLGLVLDELATGPVTLVGHSLGGAVVTQRVLDGDHRITGMLLASTSAAFVPAPVRRIAGGAPRFFRSRLGARVVNGRAGRMLVRPTFGRRARRSDVGSTLESLRRTPAAVVADQLAALTVHDVADRLHAVGVPTTVVVGRLDTLTPVRHAKRIDRNIGHARLVILPGAGHMLPLERPDHLTTQILQLAAPSKPRGHDTKGARP